MPANARLLLTLHGWVPASVTLETSEGTPLPFTLEAAGEEDGRAFWLVPAASLEPGRYVVRAQLGAGPGSHPFEFEVSLPEDHTPPDASGLRPVALENFYCFALTGSRFTWDVPASEPLGASEVELWRGEERIAQVFTRGEREIVELGSSASPSCFGNAHVPGLVAGEVLTARVRAWDLAGNAGEFESTTFTVMQVDGNRCERYCAAWPVPEAPSRLLASWLVAGVALALRRTRRQRHGTGRTDDRNGRA